MDKWLASIGLAGCVARFQAHGIEREQVGELTDADLRELGLTIGERKRFLRAVLEDSGFLDLRTRLPAERRPLSMMFVDIVGSSQLAEQLEPEDLMELLRRYAEFCAGPIARYGGRIARMVGDGILAYFCFPVANQNDPERAVRAALAITRGVGALEVPGGEPLAVRIGIATGPVVVGDLHAAGGTYRHTVVGSAPNLAARVQALVPPGGVAIGESTYQRVRDRFVCADLGSFELRGMRHPVNVWRALREASAAGRLIRTRPTPLCGRAAELAALHRAWDRAVAGQGGAVVLAGEAGIGKSRLLQAFLHDAAAGAETILLEGSPFEADSPLRPVSAWLQRLAARDDEDERGSASQRLAAALREWPACAPVLARVLGVDPQAPEPPGKPEQAREATLSALLRLLLAQAEAQPLRLVLEDLQWFDPTTLELVGRLAAALDGRRMLMLLTVRADFEALPPLPDSAIRLDLRRLDEAEVAELATSLLPGQPIGASLLAAIHRKTDGVPLFVEEIVRALVARVEVAPELARDSGGAPGLVIPASVHELLAGRLDRLGDAKPIAQAAAVIGREVPYPVLARVCASHLGIGRSVLDEALDQLTAAGVLTEAESGRRAGVFTHALLRDAAYDSLLRGSRQALHRQVAQALLDGDPETVAALPELVALHLTEGADPGAAVPYWLAAGRSSLARSALAEAISLLRRGIAALDQLPRTPELIGQRLEFMTLLGPALMALQGYGAPEAVRLYADAHALSEQVPDSPRNFPIYWGWWRVSRDYEVKLDRAHVLLSRARQRRDAELLIQAHHCAWASQFFVGAYARCCEHAEAGLAIYDQHDFRHHMHLYGNHDAKVCALGELGLARWMMGQPVTAARSHALASEQAERLGHVGSTVHFNEIFVVHQTFARDPRGALALGERLMRLAAEHGMEDARVKGMIFAGWAQAIGGDPVAGRRLLEEGFAGQRDIGTSEDFPIYVALQAETLLICNEPERALQALCEAEAEFDRTGLRFWRSELRRMHAEALLQAGASGAVEAARTILDDALRIARSQDAAMLALRAATALARVDRSPAAWRTLRDCLAAVTEDDGSAELAAARALLAGEGRGLIAADSAA